MSYSKSYVVAVQTEQKVCAVPLFRQLFAVLSLLLAVCLFHVFLIPNANAASYALRFSQDNQAAYVPNDNSLDIEGPLTIEAWVKPEAGILNKWFDFIVSKQMNGSGYALLTTGLGAGERYQFEAGPYPAVVSSVAPITGKWTHVAGVWENYELRLYVDGVLRGIQQTEKVPWKNEFPLWIGSSPFGADTNWRGVIDEVRIWREARTQQEIQENKDRYLTGNEANLCAYWSFDEGTGNTFYDKTEDQNDGSLGDPGNPSVGKPNWVEGVPLSPPPPVVYASDFSPYWHGFQFENWEKNCAGMSIVALAYYTAGLTSPRWQCHPEYFPYDPEQTFVLNNIKFWTITANIATGPSIRALEKVPDLLLPIQIHLAYLDLKTRLSMGLPTAITLAKGSWGFPESHMIVVYKLEERPGRSTIYYYDPSFPVRDPSWEGSIFTIDTVNWTMNCPGWDRFYCYLSTSDFFSSNSMMVTTYCPVDIEFYDPLGNVTSKNLQPAGTSYLEGDMDEDGDNEDGILLETTLPGLNIIHVIPEPDADPNATFSLRILSQWGYYDLVIDQSVSELPKDFQFRLDSAGLIYDQVSFEAPVTNTGFLLKDGTTVPVKFHLLDCTGAVISEQRNISLEITGPNAEGAEVTYIFNLSDGTLKWDTTVTPPHYVANFSTKTYSVKDGGHYAAVVKEDGAPIGTIGFDVSTRTGTGRGNKPL